jgi:hypothetical protein
MVVVPVDAEIYEAEDVGQEDRDDSMERFELRLMGHPEFENQDGDHDGDHGVGERFEPPRGHGSR